jgi:hypothetical protein
MIKICDICENLYVYNEAQVKHCRENFIDNGSAIFENLCQRCNFIMHYIDVCSYADDKEEIIKAFEFFSDSDKETDNFINFAETEI